METRKLILKNCELEIREGNFRWRAASDGRGKRVIGGRGFKCAVLAMGRIYVPLIAYRMVTKLAALRNIAVFFRQGI
jgi:hypothetical protein